MKPPDQARPGARASMAPYNFVPLAEPPYEPPDALPDHARHDPSRRSGQIEIDLRAETWLYTRAAVPPDRVSEDPQEIWNEDSPYRDFFHHGDPREPLVPGSSLRGMLRQLVEMLSDGRLDTAPVDPIVYRAVGDTTRFGWFYRRRFVGPNTDPANSRGGRIDPDPPNLPQRLEYPVRVPDPANPYKQYAVHAGYLYREPAGRGWYIRPAKRFPAGSDETFVHVDGNSLPEGLRPWWKHLGVHPVWVVPAPRRDREHAKPTGMLTLHHAVAGGVWRRAKGDRERPQGVDKAAQPALLVVTDGLRDRQGVPVNKHMHCAVFEPDPERRIEVPQTIRRLYLEDREISRASDREGRLLPKEPPLESAGGKPVVCFYMVDVSGSLVFLGGTLFFRLPYQNTPSRFQNGPGGLDLASCLFGTLAGPEGRALKGRVRFEDLTWDRTRGPADPFVGTRYPEPLLAPKPACIQHYLVQTSDDKKNLRHYDDRPYAQPGSGGPVTALRGFKHYWHRKASGEGEPEQVTAAHSPVDTPSDHRDTRTAVRPVKEGVVFSGRIHFDNLSEVELGALLVALDLEPSLRHKLGMARPFGFGSVRIERTLTLILDPAVRYKRFFAPAVQEAGDSGGEPPLHQLPAGAGLEAGWRPDSEALADDAKTAFYATVARFRGTTVPAGAGLAEASEAFWSADRMQDLAALLEWDQRPDWRRTAQVGVPDDQWKQRRILPPPRSLLPQSSAPRVSPRGSGPGRRTSEGRPQAVASTTPSEASLTAMGQALLAAGQRDERRARAGRRQEQDAGEPAPSTGSSASASLRTGQLRTGKLERDGSSWVAVLDGDAGTATILNEDTVPPTAAGSAAYFRIERANSYVGIHVIYEGPAG